MKIKIQLWGKKAPLGLWLHWQPGVTKHFFCCSAVKVFFNNPTGVNFDKDFKFSFNLSRSLKIWKILFLEGLLQRHFWPHSTALMDTVDTHAFQCTILCYRSKNNNYVPCKWVLVDLSQTTVKEAQIESCWQKTFITICLENVDILTCRNCGVIVVRGLSLRFMFRNLYKLYWNLDYSYKLSICKWAVSNEVNVKVQCFPLKWSRVELLS